MKKLFLFLSLPLLVLSCKKDDPQPANNTNIKTGSTWVYKYTDYDESGAVVSTSNITQTVSGTQTIGGNEYWVLSGAGTPSLVRKGTNGYYKYENGTDQLIFKLPASMNDTWRFTYSNAVGDYSDFTVKAVNENVTVPMGIIATYYVEGNDSNSLEDKIWYDETHTMVKQLEYDQAASGNNYVDYSVELVSFTP